jgi:hypothetical protein
MKLYEIKFKIAWVASSLCFLFYALSACSVNNEFQVSEQDIDKFWRRGGEVVTLDELKEGSKLYIQKCGNCHNLILPSKYTAAEWEQEHLPKEFVKAKVEEAREKRLISGFVAAKSKKVTANGKSRK